jgi:polysaccharide biosynthesis/export protein
VIAFFGGQRHQAEAYRLAPARAVRFLQQLCGSLRAFPLLLCLAAFACAGRQAEPASGDYPAFQAAQRHQSSAFATEQMLEDFDAGSAQPLYTMAPGDQITVTVWGHEELSGKHIIGPDGRVSLPIVGTQRLAYLTADEAGQRLRRAFAADYLDPIATVEVDTYASNSVLVLGRVSNPGVIHFDRTPYLLDLLARAGTLPVGGIGADKAALNRCAIFRGRDAIMWINLKALLKGRDLRLNIRLRRGDVVYIPDADDQLVYVMGEVNKPGAYRLTPDMSFMDAVAQAGGPPSTAPGTMCCWRGRRSEFRSRSISTSI